MSSAARKRCWEVRSHSERRERVRDGGRGAGRKGWRERVREGGLGVLDQLRITFKGRNICNT